MTLEYPREMLARLIDEGKLTVSASEREAMSLLIDTVFFAGLMIEEGQHVRLAIVHNVAGADGLAKVADDSPENEEDPPLAWDVTAIPRKEFDVATLAKLARGTEYGKQLVVVGGTGSDLWIDGIARIRRRTDGGSALRVATPRPGVLVFERHSDQVLRYEAGQQVARPIDVVGRSGPIRQAIGEITGERSDNASEATEMDGHKFYSYPEAALRRLIQKMRAKGSGAILALLPHEPGEETLRGVRYGRSDPLLLSKRIQVDKDLTWDSISARIATHDEDLDKVQVRKRDFARNAAEVGADELEAALDDVAHLSAIDGAVVGGPGLAIYGAGYLTPSLQLPPDTVRRALNAMGDVWEPYPSRHGARHGAGFSFVYQHPGAVAFIVSEDGPVSCALRTGDNVLVWSVEVLET